MRYGLMDRVEFRMFWEGPTFASSPSRPAAAGNRLGGASDMEVGFKWQLFPGDKDRKWIPDDGPDHLDHRPHRRHLATLFGSGRAVYQPDLRLEPCRKADPGRQYRLPGPAPAAESRDRTCVADNYQRFHQSLVAFYTWASGRRSFMSGTC